MKLRILAIAVLALGLVCSGARAQEGMPTLKQIIPQGTWPGINKAIALRGDWMAMSVAGAFEGNGNRIEIWKKTNGVWALHTTFAAGFSQFRPNQGLCASSLDFDSTATKLIAGDPRFGPNGPTNECGYPDTRTIGICEENFVVFNRTGDVWTQDPATPVMFSSFWYYTTGNACKARFGMSVQIEGDTAIVGAPQWTSPAWFDCSENWGVALIFKRQTTGWVLTDNLLAAQHAVGWIWRRTLMAGGLGPHYEIGASSLIPRPPLASNRWVTVGGSATNPVWDHRMMVGKLDGAGVAEMTYYQTSATGAAGGWPDRLQQDGTRVLVQRDGGIRMNWYEMADVIQNGHTGSCWTCGATAGTIEKPSDLPATVGWGYVYAAGGGRMATVANTNELFVYGWNPQASNYVLKGRRVITSDAPGYQVSIPYFPTTVNTTNGTFIAMSGPNMAVQTTTGALLMYEFFPDCNGNNQSDLSEIAANPLLDCDSTGNLDECEPLPVPPPVPTRSTWKAPLGGSFQDVANWCRQSPVNTTAIEFGIPFNYGVNLTQTREVKNITVSNGFPTLNFSSATQTLRSSTSQSLPTAEKFLRVGTVPGVPASLGVLNGTVNTAFGEVGVGGGTVGTLLVGQGGKVISTSELCVGCEGDGTLLLQSGGQATSQKAIIGKSVGSNGLATVESEFAAFPSVWTATLGIDVKNGTLAVNQHGSIVANPIGVILYSGGSLTGSGTIVGPVTNFGAAAGFCGSSAFVGAPVEHRYGGLMPGGGVPPGSQSYGNYGSIGTLTINGEYRQIAANPDLGTNSGSLLIEIAKRGNNITHDKIVVNGPATLGGGLFVTLATDPAKDQIDFTGLPVFTSTAIDPERPNFDIAFMPALPNGRFVKVDAPASLQGGGGAITISTSDLASLLGFGGSSNTTFDLEPLAAAVGDLDGVNGNDVAVTLKGTGTSGASANGTLLLLFNDGNGGLQNVVQLPNQLGREPVDIVAAPLRPGRKAPDLAVVNRASNTLQVLYNDGIGNFTTGQTVSTGAGSAPSSIDAVPIFAQDPTLAGIFDLVITNSGLGSLSVFFNPGDGAPIPLLVLPAGTAPTAVRGVDIDNNRFFDLIAANQTTGSVSIFMRQSSNEKNPGVSFSDGLNLAVGEDPVDLVTGDLDGDGRTDITTVNKLSNSVSVLLNRTTVTGEATFAPAVTLPTGGEPQSIVLGDFDQDTATGEPADLDIAFTARTTTSPGAARVIKVLRNDRANGVLALAPADDVLVDGSPKIIVADEFDPVAGADIVSLSLGGALTFKGGAPIATASLLPSQSKPKCALGDLNCDGTVDANDLAVVLAAWGTNDPQADIDRSGTVDASDLAFILANWGSGGAN